MDKINNNYKNNRITFKKILLCLFCLAIALFYGDAIRRTIIFFLEPNPNDINEISWDKRTIDRSGNEIVGAPGVPEHDFANGPRLERRHGVGSYIFVDRNGNNAFAREYARARPFSEGLAAVSDISYVGQNEDEAHLSFGSSPWHYIDTTGKQAFPMELARVSEFHCQRAVATTLDNPWKPICIDNKGQIVFSNPQITEIYPYSKDGYAVVSTQFPKVPNGLIDKNGKFTINNLRIINFAEGLGAFRDRATGRFGYVNSSGEILLKPKYYEAGPFSEGLAAVAIRDLAPTKYEYSTCAKYAWGYIDKSGNLLSIKLVGKTSPLRGAESFHNGRATITVW
ncbi:MAG: WG repeat-containing protein [Candidatus Obscuribacterales bacterium]|nr:WG repeat-containing protein [Candidatus Obscuribacterales bacterium]